MPHNLVERYGQCIYLGWVETNMNLTFEASPYINGSHAGHTLEAIFYLVFNNLSGLDGIEVTIGTKN